MVTCEINMIGHLYTMQDTTHYHVDGEVVFHYPNGEDDRAIPVYAVWCLEKGEEAYSNMNTLHTEIGQYILYGGKVACHLKSHGIAIDNN